MKHNEQWNGLLDRGQYADQRKDNERPNAAWRRTQ